MTNAYRTYVNRYNVPKKEQSSVIRQLCKDKAPSYPKQSFIINMKTEHVCAQDLFFLEFEVGKDLVSVFSPCNEMLS